MIENWEIHWKDYYKILQVQPQAEPEVVKAAFDRLARKYHPDVNLDATASQRMKDLNEAFEIIGNPEKRLRYDKAYSRSKGKMDADKESSTSPKPRPEIIPPIIRFSNAKVGETKTGSFVIRNRGGPFKKIQLSMDSNWVTVIREVHLDPDKELPLEIDIEVKGKEWGKSYSDIFIVKLDDIEAYVRIELTTFSEPAKQGIGGNSTYHSNARWGKTYQKKSPDSLPYGSFRLKNVALFLILSGIIAGSVLGWRLVQSASIGNPFTYQVTPPGQSVFAVTPSISPSPVRSPFSITSEPPEPNTASRTSPNTSILSATTAITSTKLSTSVTTLTPISTPNMVLPSPIFPSPTSMVYVAETPHPYSTPADYSWTITAPGAGQMRLHFARLETAWGDSVTILANYSGGSIQSGLPDNTKKLDYWSDWFPSDTVQLLFKPVHQNTAWGFLMDKIETYAPGEHVLTTRAIFQSPHPYQNYDNKVGYLVHPGGNPARIHFAEIELAYNDHITLISTDGKQQQVFDPGRYLDVWSDSFPSGIGEVKLTSDSDFTGWGFLVDQYEAK